MLHCSFADINIFSISAMFRDQLNFGGNEVLNYLSSKIGSKSIVSLVCKIGKVTILPWNLFTFFC